MNHWRDDTDFWGFEDEKISLPFQPAHEPYDPVALELSISRLVEEFWSEFQFAFGDEMVGDLFYSYDTSSLQSSELSGSDSCSLRLS